MQYFNEIRENIQKLLEIPNNYKDGYFTLNTGFTIYFNKTKIKNRIKALDTKNYIELIDYNDIVYVINLASKKGVEQAYVLCLQKELDLQKQVLALKQEISAIFKKATKIKEDI